MYYAHTECAHINCLSWLCHTHLTTLSGSDCQRTVHLNVKIIFRVSLCLFNAGNHVYIFNQLPTAKESATLWYTFPGKKLQSCPIMYVCAFTMYIHKPHALGFSIKKWSDLRPISNYLWLMPYIAHIPYICSKGRCDLLSS